MNNIKKRKINAILTLTGLLAPLLLAGQTKATLTLEECYRLSRQNYPLVKQQLLIEKSNTYSVENISKGKLPQINIAGQATYQSDVTKIPIQLPGTDIPALDKDQYKLYGEIVQPITDIITINRQKDLQVANSRLQEQNLEVELFKTRDKVNQLYFGILLLDEQFRQNQLTKKDIGIGLDKVSAAIRNGTEFRSSLDKLKAEMLKADQKDIELKSARTAYLTMLASFINHPLNDSIILKNPAEPTLPAEINRPELKAFRMQKQIFDSQNKLIDARAIPKFSVFLQGGAGRPSPVNMLSRDMSGYYIGGLRLNWSISSFYTLKKEKKINTINQDQLDVQEETFRFNINQSLIQQNAEISKLRDLINTDLEIVKLRNAIKIAANAQLDNGVITVNDYLKEINAEDQARQTASIHRIQLLMSEYIYNTTAGN